MLPDYLTEIKPLEAGGATDAVILATLQADPRHCRDIMATSRDVTREPDLLHVMAARLKVLRLRGNATWAGPLVDHFAAIPDGDETKAGFELLLTQLQLTGRPVYCHSDRDTGALTTAIINIVGTLMTDLPLVQSEIHALTGGPIYAGLTLQNIADVRAAHFAAIEADRLTNAKAFFIARMTAGGDAAAVWAGAWSDAEAV